MLPLIGSIRPNAPHEWPFSRPPGIQMARHHILPYNTLRDAWNHLVNCFAGTQLAEARVAIRQFLGTCNHRLANVDPMLDRLRRGLLSVVECNILAETAAWPAWNIVDGPSRRSDDPGDSYMDRFTFGITLEEFRRMGIIEDFYLALERFNASQPNAATLRTVIDDLTVARASFVFIDRPIPFRPEMWEREEDGLWHKRRSGDQFLAAATR